MSDSAAQAKTITLSTGATVTVRQGTGADSEAAQELLANMQGAGAKVGLFSILMHMLCEVDGEKQTIEYFRELKLGDFMAIQAAVAEENF